MDKAAMREYYKVSIYLGSSSGPTAVKRCSFPYAHFGSASQLQSLPNSKAKGKSKRITKDRGGWDAGDEY